MDHISEELLDEYALGQLPEADAAPVEEHLLACPLCQNRLQLTDEAGGSVLFESEPHAMLMSLDDASLDRSTSLALFAIGAGQVALRVAPDDYVVEAGRCCVSRSTLCNQSFCCSSPGAAQSKGRDAA